MNWKRKINDALTGATGFQIERVGKVGSAASATTNRPAKAADDLVRPPADPKTDRLLVGPVFVLSPVRSGSTLFRALLNAHSALHAPHELHVRRLTVGFGTSLAENAMEALGHNRADLEHLLWDRVLHRELVKSGKQFIVDKTPANAFAFERIRACWPDARYVFLLRHPASIARSWHEASPDKRTPEEAAADALRYMKAVEKARRALTGLTVHYEELTADPERETRRVCEFLGLPWEPGMLDYGPQAVIKKGLGDWKDKIQSGTVQPGRDLPDPEEIPELLRPMCRSWGYLPETAGPA
ncbi:sulfotransferase [Sphaerisporangium sp. TRM90804]|uniref:sulfotransferase family protein n=1 Tax=Sphaerisporangium sp. TRM90804 TaxID=3031113 RepID=UPI00244A1114|nr:sulfotransferase [Sphaerisporangium sp. TRM90804]MDH2425037.1 sulfotransferase [Sphaerisporangium sp. TRM90804]